MAHEPPGIPAPSSTAKHIEWPKVAAKEEWQKARNALLTKEKALMKENDALAAERRRLPMVEVPTDYRFLTADGETDLIGLFAGRRQLIVAAAHPKAARWHEDHIQAAHSAAYCWSPIVVR